MKNKLQVSQNKNQIASYAVTLLCSSRKNPYPHHGRSLKIPRGRGVFEAKFLEAMYENKLEFPGGDLCKTKTFHGRSMDIFWNCTLLPQVFLHLFYTFWWLPLHLSNQNARTERQSCRYSESQHGACHLRLLQLLYCD